MEIWVRKADLKAGVKFAEETMSGIEDRENAIVQSATEELAEPLAEHFDVTIPAARAIVAMVLDGISFRLARGEEVRFLNFGTFSIRDRKERLGRDPRNGEPIRLPARRAVRFKPSKSLVRRINLLSCR